MKYQSAYMNIAQNLEDQDPHTTPKNEDGSFHEAFISYLKLTYTPEEAEIVQYLNHGAAFSTVQEVADSSGNDLEYVERILSEVHAKNAIVGFGKLYSMPPIPVLININHFYQDMKPGDVEAARLYQEFFIKGGFYKYYEASKRGTSMARVIPINRAIEANQEVLSAEEAHDYILNHSADELALVPCPCRTRTEKLGIRECKDKFPIGACIMMGPAAIHFESLDLGKRVSKQQAISYFDEMQEHGLIGQTINANYGDMLICLCCGCCCSQVRGRTRWENPDALSPSNFVPKPDEDCVGCETCVDRCILEALAMDENTGVIQVDIDKCIGCGICTLKCPQESLKLYRHKRTTPFETSQELMEIVSVENREK